MKINTNLDAGDVVLTVFIALGFAKFATLGVWASVTIFAFAGFGGVAFLHAFIGGFDENGNAKKDETS